MISLEIEKVKYPIIIEVPEDYWVINSTCDDIEVEYIDGDN